VQRVKPMDGFDFGTGVENALASVGAANVLYKRRAGRYRSVSILAFNFNQTQRGARSRVTQKEEEGTMSSNTMAFLVLGLVGIVFCGLYLYRKELLWWAIIPGLAAFTLLAAGLADMVIGTAPRNDWLNVLVMGVGTTIIGLVLKRPSAKFVLYVIAAFMFLIGIAMTPLTIIPKAALIVAGIALAFFLLGRGPRQ
jgi:hypothetical protein